MSVSSKAESTMATAASGHLLPSLVPLLLLLLLLLLPIVSGDVVDDSGQQVIPHAYSSNFAQILGNLAVVKHNKGFINPEDRLVFCRTVMAKKLDYSSGTSGTYAIGLFAFRPGPDLKPMPFLATADVQGVINPDGSVVVRSFVLQRFSRHHFPRLEENFRCYRI